MAKTIIKKLGLEESIKVSDLSEQEILKIRDLVRERVTEGDLKRQIMQDITRLKRIGSYRGYRHKVGLPTKGQRTKTNARTFKNRRGKKVAIAGKKKVNAIKDGYLILIEPIIKNIYILVP